MSEEFRCGTCSAVLTAREDLEKHMNRHYREKILEEKLRLLDSRGNDHGWYLPSHHVVSSSNSSPQTASGQNISFLSQCGHGNTIRDSTLLTERDQQAERRELDFMRMPHGGSLPFLIQEPNNVSQAERRSDLAVSTFDSNLQSTCGGSIPLPSQYGRGNTTGVRTPLIGLPQPFPGQPQQFDGNIALSLETQTPCNLDSVISYRPPGMNLQEPLGYPDFFIADQQHQPVQSQHQAQKYVTWPFLVSLDDSFSSTDPRRLLFHPHQQFEYTRCLRDGSQQTYQDNEKMSTKKRKYDEI